jgi:hypothetical protein
MEVSGQLHAPAALSLGKAPGIHWTGGWAGPRAVLDAVVKRKIPRVNGKVMKQPNSYKYRACNTVSYKMNMEPEEIYVNIIV